MADVSEFEQVSRAALAALERGETIAQATVVQVRGSAPRHASARMLIWPSGHIAGTIGGGTLEERVVQHAQEALQIHRGRLEKYVFSTGYDPESVGLCGGEVLVHIEVLEADPTLVIIGAGHVAYALAQLAPLAGMRLIVVDDRAEFLTPDRFPQADRLICVQYDRQTEQLEPLPVQLTPASYVVVATWGWDEPALAQILKADPQPAYVSLISSKTKWRVIRKMLAERGVDAARLDRVRAPAGLPIGAETPGEIAIALIAEMLAVRRKAGTAA
jgi:xanthine dehydrogenase accessory factor